MKRPLSHIVLAISMALVLLFASTPADFIHSFANHKDTEHKHDAGDGPVIESPHHHCQCLDFHLMPFAAPLPLPIPGKVLPLEYPVFSQVQDERASQQAVALREGRGPPVA